MNSMLKDIGVGGRAHMQKKEDINDVHADKSK